MPWMSRRKNGGRRVRDETKVRREEEERSEEAIRKAAKRFLTCIEREVRARGDRSLLTDITDLQEEDEREWEEDVREGERRGMGTGRGHSGRDPATSTGGRRERRRALTSNKEEENTAQRGLTACLVLLQGGWHA